MKLFCTTCCTVAPVLYYMLYCCICFVLPVVPVLYFPQVLNSSSSYSGTSPAYSPDQWSRSSRGSSCTGRPRGCACTVQGGHSPTPIRSTLPSQLPNWKTISVSSNFKSSTNHLLATNITHLSSILTSVFVRLHPPIPSAPTPHNRWYRSRSP